MRHAYGIPHRRRSTRPSSALFLAAGLIGAACSGPTPDPPAPLVQEGPGFYQELSWAPDGGSILVSVLEVTEDEPGFAYRIWTVDPDGSNARPISDGPRDYWTSWAPDGERLVFAGSEDGAALDLYTMRADGSDRRRITTTSSSETQPAWSPDGGRIAFISDRDGHGQLWVMDVEGTGAGRVVETADEAQNPEWSPDGRRIAFYATNADGDDRIFTVGPDGSDLRRLVPGLWPTWTPDGQGLLYGGEGGLHRLALAGGDAVLVVAGDVLSGELSPDGTRLAYIVQEGDMVSLVVSGPNGQEPRTVMTRPRPRW